MNAAEQNDEFIQIALVNFFAKLFSSVNSDTEWINSDIILGILNQNEKQPFQNVYYEKKLKVCNKSLC
jgi:hypothetical protein